MTQTAQIQCPDTQLTEYGPGIADSWRRLAGQLHRNDTLYLERSRFGSIW